MISRPWVVAGATVAGALALVWFVQPGVVTMTPEAVETVPVAAAPVSPPEQVVVGTTVSRQVESTLEPRAVRPAAAGANVGPRAAQAPAPGETAMPAAAHSPIPNAAERDRMFRAEAVDREWAPGAEAEILRKIAELPGLKVITMRVECRSTMCRLEITLPGGAASAGKAIPADPTLDLRPHLVIASRDASGAPSTVMYFMRPGHEPNLSRSDIPLR